jgi:hypothetical protein
MGGWRSCLEWSRQVEFLAGTGSPLVRWKWSPIRPAAALACFETAEALGWVKPLEPELGALFQQVIGTLVRLCEPRR